MEINNYPNYLIYEDGKVFSKKRNKFLKPQKNNVRNIEFYWTYRLYNDEGFKYHKQCLYKQ